MAKRPIIILIGILAAFAVFFSVHYAYFDYLEGKGDTFTFKGEPLLTSADGYFYLDIARKISEGEELIAREKRAAGLMTRIAVQIHEITGIDLAVVAFHLPPFFAALMLPALFLWGFAVKRPEAGIIGAVILSLSPYWFLRTRAGFFDTDSLIPFFTLMGPYFIMKFVKSPGRFRYLHLLGALAVCGLVYFWWKQVPLFGFIVVLGSYICSVVLPSNRFERILKIGLIIACGVVGVMALAGVDLPVFEKLNRSLQAMGRHVRLILAGGGSGVLPKALVGELNRLDTARTLKIINGSYLGIAAALIGIALFYLRDWRRAVFLLPVVFMSAMFVVAARFAIFFLPMYALGIGFLCSELYRSRFVADALSRPLHRAILAGLVLLAIAVPSSLVAYTLHLNPAYNSTQASVAARAGEATEPGTLLWSTWSKGYFLGYYSGRPVFADGGTLDPVHVYISVVPLAAESPELAANWIKFFAKRKTGGVNRVARTMGIPEERALERIREILSAEDPEAVLSGLGLTPVKNWKNYMFPDTRVALYLDHMMMRTAPGWFRRGTWDIDSRRGVENQIMRFRSGGKKIEKFARETFGNGVRIGTIYKMKTDSIQKNIFDRTAEGALVHFQGESEYYFSGPRFRGSLFYSLYFEAPDDTPRFRKLFHEPRHAGLWLVE